jgi:soluble P-type ATPase
MDMDTRNKRDDIDELKKQIQNMLDINNIKNDIAELKFAITTIKS